MTNGKWGFHAGQDAKPWWQVDLGQSHPLAQVRLWNRSDTEGSAQRASKFLILLSHDGKAWREVYRHNGQIFYGYRMPERSPLVVKLTNAEARFVRGTGLSAGCSKSPAGWAAAKWPHRAAT